MDEDYEDEYAPIEGDDLPIDDPQEGPGLFDFADEDAPVDDVPQQDGPDLFGAEPDLEKARVIAAAMRPAREDEPAEVFDVNSVAPAMPSAPVAPSAPQLALYRRYRPDTFADVIGQEHVTDPLQRALTNNRVNHAYLFSGPRGCGKTSSARILARCLNCEQGPTPTPCGKCQSCQDLGRGGGGSIDVIEIDAASHGGVEDARDLRERAFFAPVSSRYKIYIVDEAHMVTTAGFNALLKLVEEPPPHVKFIFATTEPEKVIGTIRSRTHHYPFRLVPPRVLGDYLATLCEAEGVQVEPTVLPLVVRAGAGSVRDSLSVLDQLLGSATQNGVSYSSAAGLLGYTPDALLDEIMDAFAAGDASAVFSTVDKVIEVGQDPRRFAEDLLRRLRDLIIVAAVPDAASTGLLDLPEDQAQRYAVQAAGLGPGELTRAAEVMASGLTEMRGTTAPRLHLELMCARVLLPGADVGARGVHARLDRLERRLGMLAEEPQREWADAPVVEPGSNRREEPAGAPRVGATQQRPQPSAQQPPAQQPQASQPAQRPAPTAPPVGVPAQQRPAAQPTVPAQQRAAGQPGVPAQQRPAAQPGVPAQQRPAQRPAAEQQQPAAASSRDQQSQPEPRQHAASQQAEPAQPAAAAQPQQQPNRPSGAQPGQREITAVALRSVWPSVLEKVKERRRYTWMLLTQHAQVADANNQTLTLNFNNPGARDSFGQRGSVDVLRDVLIDEIGADLQIALVVNDGPIEDGPKQRPAGRPPVSDKATAPAPSSEAPSVAEPQAGKQPTTSAEVADYSEDDEVIADDGLSVMELLAQELGAEVIQEDPLV